MQHSDCRSEYPFSGIVGQEGMKTALLIAAVDPTIGGVLIRGHKGTAKSTAVRGFAAILPEIDVVEDGRTLRRPAPFVELPLGATEDRVIGTLHIEKALTEGRRQFEPGLLARAHRGALYVDEVNLLDDFLVDVLLDVSASGVNVVEREGISTRHPSRFILLGTMNPEEGELRPQFLDRFALCVSVEGISDPAARLSIAKRRVAFESDREGFRNSYRKQDAVLTQAISSARSRLDHVEVTDTTWRRAVELSLAAGSEGHRADIALVKAARALASMTEEKRVCEQHLREAALYVFPHRMGPMDTPESSAERLREILENPERLQSVDQNRRTDTKPDWDPDEAAEQIQVPGAAASGSLLFDYLKKKLSPRTSNRTRT